MKLLPLLASAVLLRIHGIHAFEEDEPRGDRSLRSKKRTAPSADDIVTPNAKPMAYLCGFEAYYRPMAEALFPEHHAVHLYDEPPMSEPTKNDVLIVGTHGMCPSSWLRTTGLYKDWKILYFEVESRERTWVVDDSVASSHFGVIKPEGEPNPENLYAFGYYEDTDKTMRFPYMFTSIFSINVRKALEEMLNAERRPVDQWRKDRYLLYFNKNCKGYREEAIGELSKIGQIYSASKCMGPKELEGTSRYPKEEKVPLIQWEFETFEGLDGGNSWRNALLPLIQDRYRFFFAMENAKQPGYLTEKLINGFVGGAIPIYYGSEEVFEIFNRESFIFYDIDDPEPALEQIAYLESNRTAYYEMLTRPILADGERTVEKFFSLADDIGGGQLKRRIWEFIGLTESTI